MNETNISISNQKKKNNNRHRSLENSNKLLKKKHSAIFKEILMNSTNESKLNKKNSNKNINHSSKNFNKKNGCFEMVNNVNIYTNTLKQDNNNIFINQIQILIIVIKMSLKVIINNVFF